MAWLPKSRTARRRLTLVAFAGGVLVVAAGLMFFALGDAVSFFYSPSYRGELPDLFREGQGVVAKGSFVPGGDFRAEQVLAKHDEKYMPRELEKALKESGEWRGEGAEGGYETGAYK